MTTLAEIKQQLNISQLTLKVEIDQNGNKTDWMIYKDVEKGIVVKIHKNLAEKLKQDSQINNLKFDSSFDGVYFTHTIDTENIQITNQATDDILKSIIEQSNKEDNQTIEIKNSNQNEKIKPVNEEKSKIKSFKFNFAKLSNSEIIVVSIVVGTIIALIMGFVFENHYFYRKDGLKLYTEDLDRSLEVLAEFNYMLGIACFIISGGITYLFLKRQNSKETIKD
jgi:hypothetical protein